MCLKNAKPVKSPPQFGYQVMIRHATFTDCTLYESLFAARGEPKYTEGVWTRADHYPTFARTTKGYTTGYHVLASLRAARALADCLATSKFVAIPAIEYVIVKVQMDEVRLVGYSKFYFHDSGIRRWKTYLASRRRIFKEVYRWRQ